MNEKCWLCEGTEPKPTEEIEVECEIPNGKPCAQKTVKVHLACLMDMEP